MKKKNLVIAFSMGGLSLAALIGLCAWMFSSPSTAPDPSAQTPEEKVEFMASSEFKSLPDSEKKEYFEKLRKEGGMREMMRQSRTLPDESRERLRGNTREMFRAMMTERVDQYFSLKTKQEKIAYLDKLIEERRQRGEDRRRQMENMSEEERKAMAERFQSRRGGRGRRGTPSLDRIKNRIENTSPEERAKFTEFRLALRARREATRKPGDPPRRRNR